MGMEAIAVGSYDTAGCALMIDGDGSMVHW